MTKSRTVHTPMVNEHIKSLRQSPIRELTKRLEEARNDPEIISFGGGQPSLPPPKFIQEKAPEYFKQIRSHRYTSTPGIPELRNAIATMMTQEEGWEGLGQNNVLVTQSATNGIEVMLSALARGGDEAMVVSPVYPGFIGALETHGLRMKFLKTSVDNGFRLDLTLLNEKIVRGKTKMLIVISPDNPTGRMLSRAEVKAIGEIVLETGITVVCDESYYRIVYEGEHVPFEDYLTNLVGVRSFSKTASATGWRIGYNYSSRELIEAMEKVNQFRVLCVSPFFQGLVYEFIMNHTEREAYLQHVVETYKLRRDAMAASVRKWLPYAKFTPPQAGFYYFIRLPGIVNDIRFSNQLFEESKVAVVPGSAFGMRPDSGYFRLTFVSEEPSKIDRGVQRIAKQVEDTLETSRLFAPDY